MTAPLIVLFAALVVFIYLLVVDEAAQVLSERAGIPFNEERSRWTRGLVLAVIGGLVLVIALPKDLFEPPPPTVASYTADSLWLGPDTLQLAYLDDEREALVRYGRELVHNTSAYFGPKGSVAPLTNGMDCENCHLGCSAVLHADVPDVQALPHSGVLSYRGPSFTSHVPSGPHRPDRARPTPAARFGGDVVAFSLTN